MVKALEAIEIARPCADVFAAITDLEWMPRWRANVVAAQWVDPEGPGAGRGRMRAVTRLVGQRFEWTCDVTQYEPPHVFGYAARSSRYEVVTAFRCAPAPTGCRLEMIGEGELPGGRVGAVAAPLFVAALLRENRKSLRTLKVLLEETT